MKNIYSDQLKTGAKIYERLLTNRPCGTGEKGVCCKLCFMGPCRLFKEDSVSVCGSSPSLVVAKNILRFVTGGAAAHSGHALHLLKYYNKKVPKNYIKSKAPEYLYKTWEEIGLDLPKKDFEHFADISEALHLTTMGVNSDYQDILKWAVKMGVIDGYLGLHLASELEDDKYGKLEVKKSKLNLDCLDPDKVNIALHGHEAILAEALVHEAIKHDDINLVGVCCTGAGLLSKYNVPLAAHFLYQEDVIVTGVVDAMVVDLQCIMPSISTLCECFHTHLITTNKIARIPNALHMPITDKKSSKAMAAKIIEMARENKKNRKEEAEREFRNKARNTNEVVVGFTEDNIDTKEIANKLENGEIKGIIGVVGCVHPMSKRADWVESFKKLSEDYVILTTGCVAYEFGYHNLLDGKRFFHLGSCVNNSRIANIFERVSKHMGKKIHELPFLVSAPMPITEKSMAIAMYFAAFGVSLHSGYLGFLASDDKVTSFLAGTLKALFNSSVFLESNPEVFYNEIQAKGLKENINITNEKRKAS